MNEALQIVGSFASILGVPLAIYLYLKSQIQKHAQVRREIVKKLSHQIGEGRTVGLFELNAVIDSLVRENQLRKGTITGNSIIEDIIADTVSSPLLDSTRKDQLILELSQLHSIGDVYQVIQNDDSIFEKFIIYLRSEKENGGQTERIKQKISKTSEKSEESTKIAELFGLIVGLISCMAAAISLTDIIEGVEIIPKIFNSNIITNLLLGIVASIVAGIIVALIPKFGSERRKMGGAASRAKATFWAFGKNYKILAVHHYKISDTEPSGYKHIGQNSRPDQWKKLIRLESSCLNLRHKVMPRNESDILAVVISRNGKEEWKTISFNK